MDIILNQITGLDHGRRCMVVTSTQTGTCLSYGVKEETLVDAAQSASISYSFQETLLNTTLILDRTLNMYYSQVCNTSLKSMALHNFITCSTYSHVAAASLSDLHSLWSCWCTFHEWLQMSILSCVCCAL